MSTVVTVQDPKTTMPLDPPATARRSATGGPFIDYASWCRPDCAHNEFDDEEPDSVWHKGRPTIAKVGTATATAHLARLDHPTLGGSQYAPTFIQFELHHDELGSSVEAWLSP